jgi:hypothetical protein
MTAAGAMQRLRIGLARLHQLIGWAGIAGVALLAAAAILIALTWSMRQVVAPSHATLDSDVIPRPVAAASASANDRPVVAELPPPSDIPLLLTQMKQAAVTNGLDWRAAEYRVTPVTPTQPASLEVRCSLKGPYPKLRSLLVQLQASIPAFAIREFSASRPNADTPDIEAKLTLAVFLQDGAAASEVPTADSPTKGAP